MAENPDDSSSDRHLLVDGILGIDVSTLVSMETFQCLMKTENIQHAIVRAYRSIG